MDGKTILLTNICTCDLVALTFAIHLVANWEPLLKTKDSFPSFTIENIMNYFIERTAGDHEGNRDYKNLNNKAFGLFKHGHVQGIEVALDERANLLHVRCVCLPEMKKNLKYNMRLSLATSEKNSGEITFASCDPCPAGKAPFASCKHIAALCYALEEFVRIGASNREFLTCKLDARSVYEIDFSKKVYGKDSKVKTALHDPRFVDFRESSTIVANQTLMDNIKTISLDCGFLKLMSSDKPKNVEYIISPLKTQPASLDEIYQRANKVKQNLFVSKDERDLVKIKTREQSKSKLWNQHRKYRITASKCKRALQKPSTGPTKAIREILQNKASFQSQKMKQGLEDERKILKLYETQLGCKVHKVGFVISLSRPFLGASPDGVVLEKCVVEVKRIFSNPNQMSLTEAVCKRGIFKMHGGNLIVNKKHPYYYQIQQQLYCTEYEYADFVLSDLRDIIIYCIRKDKEFATIDVPKLEEFYDLYIATEIAYPRIALGLPRLGKVLQ